jgi:hypothetical protein
LNLPGSIFLLSPALALPPLRLIRSLQVSVSGFCDNYELSPRPGFEFRTDIFIAVDVPSIFQLAFTDSCSSLLVPVLGSAQSYLDFIFPDFMF